jgi:hypothetical protein
MQGVRGREHLRAPAPKEQLQGVRGRGHMPAPAHQEPMQGVRGCGQHNRLSSLCKDCGGRGASMCTRNRERSVCKDCGGAGICEDNRIRRHFRDCRGKCVLFCVQILLGCSYQCRIARDHRTDECIVKESKVVLHADHKIHQKSSSSMWLEYDTCKRASS